MTTPHKHSDLDPVGTLTEDFRRHLEVFYALLKLAPPYESVERALKHFSQSLKAMSLEHRHRIAEDQSLRWDQYRLSFLESGLSKKHRGIIAGLARSGQSHLPDEYRPWLELFQEKRPPSGSRR
jgi:hypothetical protein